MKAAKSPANRFRNQQLGAIHAEKKRLLLDDETYRALLARVEGPGLGAENAQRPDRQARSPVRMPGADRRAGI